MTHDSERKNTRSRQRNRLASDVLLVMLVLVCTLKESLEREVTGNEVQKIMVCKWFYVSYEVWLNLGKIVIDLKWVNMFKGNRWRSEKFRHVSNIYNYPFLTILCNLPPFRISALSHLPLTFQDLWSLGLFCEPFSLTRASVCMIMGFELSIGAWWGQLWVHRRTHKSVLAKSSAVMDMTPWSSPHSHLTLHQPSLCRLSAAAGRLWYWWLCHMQSMTFNLMSQLLMFFLPPLLQPFLSLRGGGGNVLSGKHSHLTLLPSTLGNATRSVCIHCSWETGFSD